MLTLNQAIEINAATADENGLELISSYQNGEITAYGKAGTMPGTESNAVVVVAVDADSGCVLIPHTWISGDSVADVRQWVAEKLGPEDV